MANHMSIRNSQYSPLPADDFLLLNILNIHSHFNFNPDSKDLRAN